MSGGLSKRQEAHAVRIYGVAKEADWDITTKQIGAIIGLHRTQVGKIIRAKGWDVKHGLIGNSNRRRSGDPVEITEEIV